MARVERLPEPAAVTWPSAAATTFRSRSLLVPLGAFVASRVMTGFAVALAAFAARLPVQRIMTTWDGRWYERIARGGYPTSVPHGHFAVGTRHQAQSAVAFFPGYPLVVRAADRLLPGSMVVAGMAVTLACGATATVLVWHLASRLAGPEVADRAAVLFAFFPGAFVMSMLYAEALMVMLVALSLLALLDRRWLAAGAWAALATATRPNASAIIVACACGALVAVRQRREWAALVAPALAPAGVIAFFVFLWRHTGESLIWFRVEREGWGESVDFGRQNAQRAWALLRSPLDDPNRLIVFLSLLLAVAALVLLWRARLPLVVTSYTVASLALVLTSPIGARPRFVFAAFPLVIAVAMWAQQPIVFGMLAGASAAATTMLTVFYGLHRASYYP